MINIKLCYIVKSLSPEKIKEFIEDISVAA